MGWRRGATLGKGRFGVVSLAHTEPQSKSNHAAAATDFINLPSPFAVKSAAISQYHSLHTERQLLCKFQDCPYILRCYGYDVTREKGRLLYNLLLEYASGGSLIDRIRSRALPECDVRRYTKMILSGLAHIHKSGYVHCDLKPHNILIAKRSPANSCSNYSDLMIEEETVKISDFGLSKKVGGGKNPNMTTVQKKGEPSVLLSGTPLYMAPETVREGEYEPHSDIWALGCTVLQMITGKLAWNCDCDDKSTNDCPLEDLLFRIGYTTLMPEIPFWISNVAMDFLKKCLVRDPKNRWTANKLLKHPFVLPLSICDDNFMMMKEEGIRNNRCITIADDDLPKPNLLMLHESFDDLPKPNLLMLDPPNPNCLVSVLLKRKRAAYDDAEEDGRCSSRNNYCRTKRNSFMPDLCDAVPLGF